MTTICLEIPIRTVSEMNCQEHWTKKHTRHKRQKYFVQMALRSSLLNVHPPCHIVITRMSPMTMDFDNLVCSQKYVVDAICDLLNPGLAAGRADGDERIKVDYAQEKSKIHAIRVNINY